MLRNIPEHAILPVLVVDLEGLTCIEASASDFNGSGCRILSSRIDELQEVIGLRVDGVDKMVRGQIVSILEDTAEVSFRFTEQTQREKRKEKRKSVRIPVRVCDAAGQALLSCTIVDASKSGCRLQTNDADFLPDQILLTIQGLDLPVMGRVAWRSSGFAGVQFLWQFSSKKELAQAKALKTP